ncbi:MAG: hypothetical protein ACFE8B_09935 [Candidatus Hermodarchaeota archaeon]
MFTGLESKKIIQSTGNIIEDIINGLENWCIAFNELFLLFSKYLKYIFVFMILFIGIFTLLRFRGVYQQSRQGGGIDKKEDVLTKPRLILGTLYIVLAFGILFNYLTYFFIWIFEPLPDRLIYNFIDFIGIDPFYLNGIKDISVTQYPHEKTIYYCFSFASLMSVLTILLSLWYLINNNRLIHNPMRVFGTLVSGIMGGILFGFTTYLPFFL